MVPKLSALVFRAFSTDSTGVCEFTGKSLHSIIRWSRKGFRANFSLPVGIFLQKSFKSFPLFDEKKDGLLMIIWIVNDYNELPNLE